jgi:methyltransferase (TIGR00027 family)
VRYFEIDHPDTLAFKESVLRRAGATASVTYVPGDYLADGVFDLLIPKGYQPARPTFFLWEGNSTYLSMADVRRVLGEIRGRASGFALAFDYMSEKVITRSTGQDDLDTYIDHIAGMGAPWLSGIDDIAALAGELGLEVGDSYSAAELFARYRPGQGLDSKLFDHYFVATLLSR